jgi:hypothetical protein
MRTKALLIAVAALAAGVITSQAQVYSQNIVGYVNQPLALGYTTFANTFDESAGDSVTNILQPGPYDGYLFSVWNGTGYNVYTIDSGFPTGVANAADSIGEVAPTLPPGVAFFISNPNGSNTLTVVGTVHIDGPGTATNVVGTTTNTIGTSPSESFLASKLPIGGGLKSVLGLDADDAADGDGISIPLINSAGQITSFAVYTLDSGFPSGFANGADSIGEAEPILPVGGGFFFSNANGVPVNWVQSY